MCLGVGSYQAKTLVEEVRKRDMKVVEEQCSSVIRFLSIVSNFSNIIIVKVCSVVA